MWKRGQILKVAAESDPLLREISTSELVKFFLINVSDDISGDGENEGNEYDMLAGFTRTADKKKLRKPNSNASDVKKLKKKMMTKIKMTKN
jgi:hypothetical protein